MLLMGVIVTSCLGDVEIPGGDNNAYDVVYMPQAYNNPNVQELKYEDAVKTIVYGAYFGGYGYPAQNIEVQFEVDESQVALYNEVNGTNYDILPSGSYSIINTANIAEGELSGEDLKVTLNPVQGKLELFKKYLLPISIKSVSGNYLANPNLDVTYFVVSASLDYNDYSNFDRTNWVVTASSDEPAESNGEFPNNGLALAAIDGALNSFWHTKWSGGEPSPPHWLTVDMGETKEVHGFVLYGRQSNNDGKPKDVVFEVSADGENWVEVKNVTLQNVNDKQRFFVDAFVEGRYFRMTVNTTFADKASTHLAEIYAF